MVNSIRRCLTGLACIIYHNVKYIFLFGIYLILHPLSNPWPTKLRLEPPQPLKDPKFGVHKYAKVNNIKMHYVESGDHSKELMIFVHGFPEFWYSWRHQIIEFQKDYWVVAIDMRGYGDSEKPPNVSDYKLPLLVDDLKDLIQYLGREKCIMVAHDWGALIGWAFRRRYPQMLKALITMGGTCSEAFAQLLWNNPEQFKKSWYIFFFQGFWVPEMLMRFKDLEIFQAMRSEDSRKYVTDEDIECYKYMFGKPGAFTPPINYYRCNFNQTNEISINDKIKVPSLLITGGNDEYLIADNGKKTKEIYKETEWLYSNNFKHFMQQENPIEINSLIRNFIKNMKAGA